MADESVLGPTISSDNKVHKASPPSISALSPISASARSCVTCRKRKVKCDKKHPCNHCIRQGIDCTYPPPGRAPRKPRKPQDAALVERLRRLEAVVQTLGAQVSTEEEEEESPKDADTQETQEPDPKPLPESNTDERLRELKREFKELVGARHEQHMKNRGDGVDDLTERFGTLLVKQGRSRYINPGFWSMFNAEVEDIKGQVLELSDAEDEEYSTPQSHSSSATQGFIFGLSSTNVQMSLLRPEASHIMRYWETYCENVEPLVKMLHRSIKEPHVVKWSKDIDNIPKEAECLLFAICFAAVTSTPPEECYHKFGESKTDLLTRYRFGMEQALARADFLQTDSIFVLQAFIMFLTCLRRSSDTRLIWSLSAMAVRISQGLGLHRDGSHYKNLPIYKQEARRVLWWHTIVLDSRVCEDLGSDAAINGRMWDTKLPRNLNESDITFGMTELPESRLGCTDMTFNLIRFEIGAGFAKILRGQHKYMVCPKRSAFSDEGLEKRRQTLLDLQKSIEEKYLKDADLTIPINWVSATVSRMILSKMWLMLYQPFQRKDGGRSLPQETRDELFVRALENVEHAIAFHTEAQSPKYKKFSWMLQTYTQWHAIAFLLSELCNRTAGPEVERAWKAVDFSMEMSWSDGSTIVDRPDAHLWKPLRVLRERARAERDKALAIAVPDIHNPDISDWIAQPQANDNILMAMSNGLGHESEAPQTATPSTNGLQAWPTTMQPTIHPTLDTTLPNVELVASDLIHETGYSTQQSFSTQPQLLQTSGQWLGSDNTGIMVDNTGLVNDASMNWNDWNDLVEQWGAQNQDQIDGNGLGPSFFGGGTNWY